MSQNLHNSQASSGHSIGFDLHHPPYSKQLLGLGLPGQTDQRTNHHDHLKLCHCVGQPFSNSSYQQTSPPSCWRRYFWWDWRFSISPCSSQADQRKAQASDVGFGYLLSHSFIYLSPQIYGLKLPMPSKNTFNCVDSRKVSFLQHPYNTRF